METETDVTQEAESPEVIDAPAVETQDKDSRSAGFAVAVWHMVERVARWTVHQLARPRVRTSVVGIVLILIAALFVGHSFWTAPLVIVGALMIIVAWVGSRLEGRFAVEWSETGTGFELNARFKSAASVTTPQVTAQSTAHRSVTPTASPRTSSTPSSAPSTEAGSDDDVIEGEAHTMEIDPEELRAIVAAIEQVAPLVQHNADIAATHVAAPASNGHHVAADVTAD